ncbi:MAG: hypothetical protein V4489_06325 [Chlamydiota bacterium]
MIPPLIIKDQNSICSYFKPILKIFENNPRSVQDIALPALQALVTQLQTPKGMSLSSLETIAKQTKELQKAVKASSNETTALIAPEIEKIFTSLSGRLPCFRFHSSGYEDPNNSLPDTYFEDESKKAVDGLVEKIREAVQNDTISECFLESLHTLGLQRQEIAKNQGSCRFSKFGELRYSNDLRSFKTILTPFSVHGPYHEHRLNFLRALPSLINIASTTDTPVQGCTSTFTAQCFDKNSLPDHSDSTSYSYDEARMLTDLKSIKEHLSSDQMTTSSKEEEKDLPKNKKAKSDAPPPSAFDDPSAFLIYIKTSLEKDATSYPLSTYFIFVKKEDYENKRFASDDTELVAVHQTLRKIKESLKEVQNFFIKCINSRADDELKENMAVFRYLLAHVAPYRRGSAWVAETIEKAVYRYKGYEFSYGLNPTPSDRRSLADLDALSTLRLSQFKRTYLLQANLKKIEDHK